MRESIQDKNGYTIYLTDERWQHIIRRHPALKNLKSEVIKTIRIGKREQDEFYPNKFYYRKASKKLPRRYTHIEVVVRFGLIDDLPNNFVVTAYPITIT